MKKILKAPLMLILVPLDYIGWNLSYPEEKISFLCSIRQCWKELMK